ncbi:SDR family NAD(P)-dependent oxidoreductase [Ramlibacter albus]|uniref:SDR family oxidoreductase n=1 Tax=Ramlibacter albus TaxID=2079448 RepID=A0A923MA89_9BURK|nr:SDR family oxidoreductase [Ramlibacter albus]MBC5765624.1 SDR family oxidoreductase [Ramlibacter albus]
MGTWQGKTAFITGGASGIGRALAKALTAGGASVCVTDIDGAGAQRVAQECGGSATSMTLDVCDATATSDAVQRFARERGRLDYMFNNAGIGMGGEVHEIPLEAWHRVVDINIWGVVHGVQAAYPLMRQQGFGHIVNTASMAGLGPAPLLTPYALTKHAVVGLSASLRVEAAPFGVRVSVVCPGVIETPILASQIPPEAGAGWWLPDVRRYLTKVSGMPYPVDRMAAETLDGVARNRKFIVVPRRARVGWLLGRLFPSLPDAALAPAVAYERAQRGAAAAGPAGDLQDGERLAS